MTARKAPPEIFSPHLITMRKARAARRQESFITIRCALDAAERLQDINRQFEHALIIAPPEFQDHFLNAFPPEKCPKSITWTSAFPVDSRVAGQFDLIISILELHAVNDLPGRLIQMRTALQPDGLFIGAMFGGDTLANFRSALYEADEVAHGGISPRIYPYADYSQAAQLLHRAGLALPVVDTDRFEVRYGKWQTLIDDLRDLGETNALAEQTHSPVAVKALDAAVKARTDTGGKFPVGFEILWLTGWHPHASQQKPLKPGSAKIRLADVLESEEKPLKRH